MPQPIFVVDAFAERPVGGNPAGVCPLVAPRPDSWMQSVAAEMRHAETAFLVREGAAWRLRWFTPSVEVDLCGHATLASAHVLFETGAARDGETIRFLTKSGELRATPRDGAIEIDLPVTPVAPCAPPDGLAEALGVTIVRYGSGNGRCVAELATASEVRAAKPDMRRLATIPPWGVSITARSDDPRFDFVSRFFAPAKGVDEDPVTGSAHCALVDWWSKPLGKTDFVAYQASARGGVVRVRSEGGRALLSGRAVTVLRGELAV
jgi:PhzF family phenazine biosynthesis protein